MARISTHVLDTARGEPAKGLVIDLHFGAKLVRSAVTNMDGRTDQPLISGDRLETGVYELTFHAGDYFRAAGVELADPPFLDVVIIRFGVANAAGNYHVPLLLSPYCYSTYRGS
jgi:5-hydroxyisourate hydrolase